MLFEFPRVPLYQKIVMVIAGFSTQVNRFADQIWF